MSNNDTVRAAKHARDTAIRADQKPRDAGLANTAADAENAAVEASRKAFNGPDFPKIEKVK
ncbi:hypothetical protein F3087_18285 [Nocardia colli]|uniref:Uncharacterized protein n=1 Tax=Nocardia colli TaxID=2545717 RepID=A0A5N0EDW4_9NOCA|nr:hypothetical protein [Nocardia colli]KAA8887608.1 hypothetical protein F3087_18285 [Nocardia colli]